MTKTSIGGQWEGELNGKVGHFPFTHVKFIESSTTDTPSTNISSENGITNHIESSELDLNALSVS